MTDFQYFQKKMMPFTSTYFYLGLLGAWIVGMGRHWDDSAGSLLQHLGLGSVIYLFVLAFFIGLTPVPFKIEN
jgi:hypothetical protein